MPSSQSPDLLQSTLDLMVLKTLTLGRNHGVGVGRPARGERLAHLGMGRVGEPTACQVLHPHQAGRRRLETETENWDLIATAIRLVLAAT